MKAALGFAEIVGGIAFFFLLVRAGYGVIATEARPAGTPLDFAGLVRPYLIGAGLALVTSIGANRIRKRM